MHFVAWNGEQWSMPFQPNELMADSSGGLIDRCGCSVAWDAEGYRGENWIALKDWTEERAKAISSTAAGVPQSGSEASSGVMPLMDVVLSAWNNGMKRWREKHESYPTAFSELAHVMEEVQAHVDSANKSYTGADEGGVH